MKTSRLFDEKRHPLIRALPTAILLAIERGLDFTGPKLLPSLAEQRTEVTLQLLLIRTGLFHTTRCTAENSQEDLTARSATSDQQGTELEHVRTKPSRER